MNTEYSNRDSLWRTQETGVRRQMSEYRNFPAIYYIRHTLYEFRLMEIFSESA